MWGELPFEGYILAVVVPTCIILLAATYLYYKFYYIPEIKEKKKH